MVCFENAKVIDGDEIREIIEEVYTNPTLERLMFIEAKEKDPAKPSKVFPCYLEAWGMMNPADPSTAFVQMTIVQSINNTFQLLQVRAPAFELGVTKRIWDKPPTKGLRMETPWIQEVPQ